MEELDRTVAQVEMSLEAIEKDVDAVLRHRCNVDERKKEIANELSLTKQQHSMYKYQLRQLSTRKDHRGNQIMDAKTKERYSQHAAVFHDKLNMLRKKLASVQNADREELLEGGVRTLPDKPRGEWTAQDHWEDTKRSQERTEELAKQALGLAHQGKDAGERAREQMDRNTRQMKKISAETEKLEETYDTSFQLMAR